MPEARWLHSQDPDQDHLPPGMASASKLLRLRGTLDTSVGVTLLFSWSIFFVTPALPVLPNRAPGSCACHLLLTLTFCIRKLRTIRQSDVFKSAQLLRAQDPPQTWCPCAQACEASRHTPDLVNKDIWITCHHASSLPHPTSAVLGGRAVTSVEALGDGAYLVKFLAPFCLFSLSGVSPSEKVYRHL